MLRWLTAGESHGPSLVAILEGLPAHVRVTTADLQDSLARRRLGYGRGARMKFEQDEVTIVGGVRHGETQGGPVAVQIGNTEWPKWEKVMSADPVDPVELEALARNAALTRPRPGHADLVGMQKYAFDEARPILERASARETAARVALGRVASNFLEQAVGARVVSHVVELGGVPAPAGVVPLPDDVARLDDDPVRCLDPEASAAMVAAIDQAHKDGDTLGGVVEVVVHGLPPGLGSHVHWDRRLDARLAGALMGIQAIKGVEVGDGFELAATPGSRAHDEIVPTDDGLRRTSGRSGGTEGGMSTGEVLRVRAAMKPIATVPQGAAHRRRHHRRGDGRPPPALRRVRGAGRRDRRRGDGRAGARRGGAGEVRRRLRAGDPAQRRELPGHPEVQVITTLLAHARTRSRPSWSARWARARPRSGGWSPRRGASPCATPTPTSWRPRGAAISDIFVDSGEEHFRALEAKAVAEALATHDGVLALGGGAVLDPATRELLAGHPVVFLRVGLSDAVKRVGLGSARPLLLGNVRGRIKALLDERTPVYESVATLSSTPTAGAPRMSPARSWRDCHEPDRAAGDRRCAVRRGGRRGRLAPGRRPARARGASGSP